MATLVLCACAAVGLGREADAATISVKAGGDLQAAIDAAQPGDTILIDAGAVFTGNYRLRAKGGTSYITIRSAAPDSSLPPAGTRITPAYASLLPKIRSDQNGPAFRIGVGANYWRLLFLEIYPSTSVNSSNLVELGGSGSSQTTTSAAPHHLQIDRCYIHGDASYGQRRGIALNSAQTDLINSYLADFKMAAQDTQAIAGWNGPGPYRIENNYIEGAAENILFGGSDPSIPNLVPANITIRRNHIAKPMAWRSQSWVIKNLIEFKNAQDVLVEGNTIENDWTAGQNGYAILFTPRNQGGTAPWSVVKNITVQNNVIRHVAGVFNISGYDDEHVSQQTTNLKLRNNLIYDISTAYGTSSYPADGRLVMIGNGPSDVVFDHNTVDNDGSATLMLYGGTSSSTSQIAGFVLTNNLLRRNKYGLFGATVGEGTAALKTYAPGAVVLGNTFAGGTASVYPSGNDFPTLTQWLADFVNRSAGDYQLLSTSLSNNAATDGKDIGVDFTELNAAMTGTATPAPTSAPSGSPTPYSGTPVNLPGKVEAENYDRGGEGVAYHDTTAGNSSGVYRSDDVDLQTTTDTGGGYKVKSAVASEWLKYTVNVQTAGTYAIDVRVSSSGTGGTFHIEVNGVNKTGTLTVSDTGGWETWKTVTKTGVSLSAGQQVVRLVLDSNGGSGLTGNFNWIQVRTDTTAASASSSPFGGTPFPMPGRVEAENYDIGGEGVAYHDTTAGNASGVYRHDDVDLQTTPTGGYKVKSAVAGEWLKYTVDVQTAGTYSIDVRASSVGAGGTFHVEVNGVNKTGTLTVPNTGGWDVWNTVTKSSVSLSAGEQVIRLVLDSNGASGLTGNFNWIQVR